MTSIVSLNIPVIIQGTKQSVEYFPKILDLNEGYQQVTGSKEHKVTWTLVSAIVDYDTIKVWTDFLDSFNGATLFNVFLCDEIGTKSLFCDSYALNYTTYEKGQLTMECTENNDYEDTTLLSNLAIETIPYSLSNAYDYMTRFGGNTNTGGYRYFGYPEVIPTVFVHPGENDHVGTPTPNTGLQKNGGMQAYPDVCGNTESAFLNILALCEASEVLNDPNLKTYASGIATALLVGACYRGGGSSHVPNPPNAFKFLPHRLFTIRDVASTKKLPTSDFQYYGGQGSQNETQATGLWSAVTFSQIGTSSTWRAQMPVTLDCVYKVISYTQQSGQTQTKDLTSKVISGTELPINYWVDKNNKHCFYYSLQMLERGTNTITGDMPGYLYITAPSDFNGSARVVHTVFDTVIPKGTAVSADSFWRSTNGTEFNVDLSTIKYVWQAYDALSSDTLFARARDATQASIESIINLTNPTDIFNSPDVSNVFDIPGLNFIQVNNRGGYISRLSATQLKVTQLADTTNSSSLVVQQSYNLIQWDENTVVSTTLSSNLNAIYDSQFIELKFDVDINGSIVVYKIALPIPYSNQGEINFNITYKDLLTWGESNWYPTHRNDPFLNGGITGYGTTDGTVSIVYERQMVDPATLAFVVRFNFHNFTIPDNGQGHVLITPRRPWGNNPPRFNYRLKTGRMSLTIYDSSSNKFKLVMTPEDKWKIATYEWGDFTPVVAGTVPVLPVKYVQFETYQDEYCELSLYWFGLAPTIMPVPLQSKRTYFENKIRFAHTWFIGTTTIGTLSNAPGTGNTLGTIPFTPGILPRQVTIEDTKRPKFSGQVHIGFQTYRLWQIWQRPLNASLVLEFLKQSSENFQSNSPIQQVGLFRPLYALALWDLAPQTTLNTFYDISAQPFPEWTVAPEPLSMIWTLKLVTDLAESWRNDPTNADLERLVMNYISAINDFWLQNGLPGKVPNFITDVSSTTPMIRDEGIFFPEGSALLLSIAIDANIVGKNRLLTFKTIDSCLKYLRANEQQVGVVYGSWTFNAQDIVCNNTTYKKNRTDAHAHCMRAYSKLWRDRNNLRFPTRSEWNSSNI